MEQKPATIKEIAQRLNVSVSTVSRALHNHPSIGLRTKMQVKNLATELNYEPNQTAISFKKGKTFTIGVILPISVSNFFPWPLIESKTLHRETTIRYLLANP
jgi:LacI family transcriptional regulator